MLMQAMGLKPPGRRGLDVTRRDVSPLPAAAKRGGNVEDES